MTDPTYYLDAGDQIDSHKVWDVPVPEDRPIPFLLATFQRDGETPQDTIKRLLALPSNREMPDDLRTVMTDYLTSKPEMVAKMDHEPLDRSPKKNWVERAGQLPAYIQHIAKDLHEERGMPLDRAIAVAISRVKLWAAGGGNVKPDTKAKAEQAVAEWEALKAKAHMKKG